LLLQKRGKLCVGPWARNLTCKKQLFLAFYQQIKSMTMQLPFAGE